MAKVRVNLYGPQTRETRGYADTERDVAVVTGVVSDLPASGTNIQLAEQLCIGSGGTAHPNYTGLEPADAQGHRLNDTSVWVVLLYGRTPASVPTIPATSNVREITEYVWDENQIGTATITLQPFGGQETERLIYYYRSGVIPVSRFQMRTVLNEHPGTAIDALSGKVNATPYGIAGR